MATGDGRLVNKKRTTCAPFMAALMCALLVLAYGCNSGSETKPLTNNARKDWTGVYTTTGGTGTNTGPVTTLLLTQDYNSGNEGPSPVTARDNHNISYTGTISGSSSSANDSITLAGNTRFGVPVTILGTLRTTSIAHVLQGNYVEQGGSHGIVDIGARFD